MSFDGESLVNGALSISFNPFGTGQCLSTSLSLIVLNQQLRFNPFGTGQCLSTKALGYANVDEHSFNPFGTGQCLSTAAGCSSLVWQGFPEPLPKLF